MTGSQRTESVSSAKFPAAPPAWGPQEFAAQFKSAYRLFWLIAVSIVKDPSTAEDVVQEAAIIGLEKLPEFRPGSNFKAWMGKTVRYVALNLARREGRRRGLSLEADASPGRPEPAAEPRAFADAPASVRGRLAADQPHFDDRVVAALNALGATARACLLLRTVEGLGYAEIAALLDIPPGTAMSHVHRTRMHLREALRDCAPRRAEQTGGGP